MNKNRSKHDEQQRKLRGIRLNRETIQVLNDPALLEHARAGMGKMSEIWPGCPFTTSGGISEEDC